MTVRVTPLSANYHPWTNHPCSAAPRVGTPADYLPHFILPDLPPPRAVALRCHPNPFLLPDPPMYPSEFSLLAIHPYALPTPYHTYPVTHSTHIPPDIKRYLLQHRRHQEPTLIRARYASAAVFLDQAQANAVTHTITRAIQEFLHLIRRPTKSIW